jgi:hypothetical protein
MLLEEARQRVDVHFDAVGQAALEPREALGLEVLRAAGGGVAPRQVHPPEVIVRQGQARKDRFQAVVHEPADAPRVLRLDLAALWPGDAKQGERAVAVHGEPQRAGPEAVVDLVVDEVVLMNELKRAAAEPIAHGHELSSHVECRP